MTARNIWEKQEEEILVAMIEKGKTADEIGKVLRSRTIDGIRNKANSMGLKFKKAEPEIDMEEFKRIMGGRR